MTVLSTADLTGMRTTQTEALPDTGTLQRVTLATDSAGGYTETWATVASPAVRIKPTSPREVITGERRSVTVDWLVTFTQGTDVRAGDRVTVGSRTYAVIELLAGSWETARQTSCIEVR